MIHHYKSPVIRQQRDVYPKYQSPDDPNYDYKLWGRPTSLKSSTHVRLTIDVDFDYDKEDAEQVRIILEQLGVLLCQDGAEAPLGGSPIVQDDIPCPGCGCLPGDGRTPGCNHPEGCGFNVDGMCMDTAPAGVAACVPPDELGRLITPWCHLPKGHRGPHRCGEHMWGPIDDDNE